MKKDTQKPAKEGAFLAKKSLGQNFLTSEVVPQWMCTAADLTLGDVVLEIGPGTGALTKILLKDNIRVIALETDDRAIKYLTENFAPAIKSEQLVLFKQDVRYLDLEKLGLQDKQFKVVANIPYYLSGFLLRKLLDSSIQPKTLVFLLQKELVTRIARAKKESLLSLSVKVFGTPTYIKTVSRGHFEPTPKVDSAILQVANISNDKLQRIGNEHFFTILHLGLQNKRKQLLGNLSQNYEREAVIKIFTQLNLPLTLRGEDLKVDGWLELALSLKALNKAT